MKSWLRANRGFLAFLLCLGLVRTAIADYNPIPSGSMRPTLLEGDVVLVNRLAYDLKVPLTQVTLWRTGDPRRGDIVTLFSPLDGTRLIKRIVGLPGDRIAMRDDVLFINGVPARYEAPTVVREPGSGAGAAGLTAIRALERGGGMAHVVQFLPQVPAMRSFAPVQLAPDTYFVMGDNRDNSNDSRYIGVVPRRALIGRAHHVLLSVDILGHWLPRAERTSLRLR